MGLEQVDILFLQFGDEYFSFQFRLVAKDRVQEFLKDTAIDITEVNVTSDPIQSCFVRTLLIVQFDHHFIRYFQ